MICPRCKLPAEFLVGGICARCSPREHELYHRARVTFDTLYEAYKKETNLEPLESWERFVTWAHTHYPDEWEVVNTRFPRARD